MNLSMIDNAPCDDSSIAPSVSPPVIDVDQPARPKIPRPMAQKKTGKSSLLAVNPVLTELAVVVASETASGGKLTDKRKGDFTASFAMAKAKAIEVQSIDKNRELDIASRRLDLEEKIAEGDLEHKKLKLHEEISKDLKVAKEATKKDLIIQMMQLNKTPDEINDYLTKLGYDA